MMSLEHWRNLVNPCNAQTVNTPDFAKLGEDCLQLPFEVIQFHLLVQVINIDCLISRNVLRHWSKQKSLERNRPKMPRVSLAFDWLDPCVF
jgi:hypothetical protein